VEKSVEGGIVKPAPNLDRKTARRIAEALDLTRVASVGGVSGSVLIHFDRAVLADAIYTAANAPRNAKAGKGRAKP